MKLTILSTTTGIALGHINSEHKNNDGTRSGDVDLGNDIRLTPCQAEKFEVLGISVPAGNVGPSEDNKCDKKEKAQASEVNSPKWDGNWSASENRWLVAYYFDAASDYADATKATIRDNLKKWEEQTCVKLVEKSATDTDFQYKLNIKKDGGCWSYVGRYYTDQPVSLDSGCEWGTTPLHEVMHALGFWHEQQRGDRDDYVTINQHHSTMDDASFNVNFGTSIFTWEPTGLGYDFDSIMHYSAYATSSCWPDCPVITYKGTDDPVETTYHSRGTFSDIDIAEINMRYPCDMSLDEEEKTTEDLVEEIDTLHETNRQKMNDWSEENNFGERKEKLTQRMARVDKMLNYLDGSASPAHYFSKRSCVDYDTTLPSSVMDYYNAHSDATNSDDFFDNLKDYFHGALDHITRDCPNEMSNMQMKFIRVKDRFSRVMAFMKSRYEF